MGKEELCEVGNGGVVMLMWMGDGDGIAKVSRVGIDEGCDGAVCYSSPWEGAKEGVWWVRNWDCECERGCLGEWDGKVLGYEAAEACVPVGERGSGKMVCCGAGRLEREALVVE